MVRQR